MNRYWWDDRGEIISYLRKNKDECYGARVERANTVEQLIVCFSAFGNVTSSVFFRITIHGTREEAKDRAVMELVKRGIIDPLDVLVMHRA